MNTEAEIRVKGMHALIGALGLLDAQRFMAANSRDRFNYTEWRRQGLPDMALQDLAVTARCVRWGLSTSPAMSGRRLPG